MPSMKHLIWVLALAAGTAWGGAQRYEPLAASVKAQLSKAVADTARDRAAQHPCAAGDDGDGAGDIHAV